jgi:hypothetical protein
MSEILPCVLILIEQFVWYKLLARISVNATIDADVTGS